MIEIAASVLSADFSQLGTQLRECFAAGLSRVHVDVMDGQFVPNLSMGPDVLRAVRKVADEAGATVSAHLMIVQPERFIAKFVEAGAHRVSVHVENAPLLARTLNHIHELGAQPSVAINPATPLVMLENVLDLVSSVLVMSVDPGFGGQRFNPSSLSKIERLRKMLDERGRRDVAITVDGGVNTDTIGAISRAGAGCAVSGSGIFNSHGSVAENIAALRAAATSVRV
jgi:ribulose-phosphate 3-epimerase